jgi:pimeloyl-ACP methyl ester carboxylesterase/DNA-binding CsgD family transcriptional regulator
MMQKSEQIRFCKSRDGARIAYAVCGSGPPLVWATRWVHHLKFDWESPVWRPWLALLMRRHTLIRYDFRGCGLSDREHVEFSFDRYVEDLEAVVDAAGVDKFALFGMGNGGTIATVYAVRHPSRVTYLVLLGSSSRGRLRDPTQVEEAQTRLHAIKFGWQGENPAFTHFTPVPDAPPDYASSYSELRRLTTSTANAVEIVRSTYNTDVRETISQVQCPTLVLHARGDAIHPFDEGRTIAALIPGARFVPLESRNHIILDVEPAWRQFADALDEFLPRSTGADVMSFDELTARERDILEVVALGLDNAEIASRLKISEKTVRNHVSIIFSKLGFHSRAQVIVRAREAGFGNRRQA